MRCFEQVLGLPAGGAKRDSTADQRADASGKSAPTYASKMSAPHR